MVFSKSFRNKTILFAPDIEQYLTFNFIEDDLRNTVWSIKPNDIVIDIGTDFGPYTLTALSQGAKHVYAVEPRQNAIDKLVQNLEYNNYSNRVTIIQKIVSDVANEITTIGEQSTISSIVKQNRYRRFKPEQEIVPTTTIDEIVSDYDTNIDWIKIDVEGAEYDVLEGGMNTLKDIGPSLLIENHNAIDPSIESKINQLLTEIGYKMVYKHKEFLQTILGNNTSHTVFKKK